MDRPIQVRSLGNSRIEVACRVKGAAPPKQVRAKGLSQFIMSSFLESGAGKKDIPSDWLTGVLAKFYKDDEEEEVVEEKETLLDVFHRFTLYTGTSIEFHDFTMDTLRKLEDFLLHEHEFKRFIGLRVGDFMKMTKDNIINGAIEYIPRKTKEGRPVTVRVPISPTAQEILDRYPNVPGNRLLPFICEQDYNRCIKDMIRLAGIDRNVTVINTITREEQA